MLWPLIAAVAIASAICWMVVAVILARAVLAPQYRRTRG